jgi:hypothetical protein
LKDVEGGYLFRISLGYLKDIAGYLKRCLLRICPRKIS